MGLQNTHKAKLFLNETSGIGIVTANTKDQSNLRVLFCDLRKIRSVKKKQSKYIDLDQFKLRVEGGRSNTKAFSSANISNALTRVGENNFLWLDIQFGYKLIQIEANITKLKRRGKFTSISAPLAQSNPAPSAARKETITGSKLHNKN